MRPVGKAAKREGIIFICFVVFGFVILPFFFADGIGEYYQGLSAASGMNLMATWAIILGPCVAYLVVRATMWLIKAAVLFIKTIGYVVDASHETKALAKEERLSGRFATGEARLAEEAHT